MVAFLSGLRRPWGVVEGGQSWCAQPCVCQSEWARIDGGRAIEESLGWTAA